MQFIDHTGHIFSMPSYSMNPIGYEYEETNYIFWIDSEYSSKLSVDTYYMKPIRVLVKYVEPEPIITTVCEYYNPEDARCQLCQSTCQYCFNYAPISKLCKNYHPEWWENCRRCQNTCEFFWDDINTINNCPHYNIADQRCRNCGRMMGNFRNNLNVPAGCEHRVVDPEVDPEGYDRCQNHCGNGCEYFWENVDTDKLCVNYNHELEKCQNCSSSCQYFLKFMDNKLNKQIIIEPEELDYDPTAAINITIEVDSKKFGLIGSKTIHDKIESNDKSVTILESEIKQKLRRRNIELIPGIKLKDDNSNSTWALITFYVVCKSDEPGTWESNIMIHIDDDWCPITIGAEIVDECEELIINGRNVGISLPKDILKAVYQANTFSDVPDERLYAQKMKELLMNYMSIKGEEGNYKSAIAALNWFGWGDKIKLYKLLHTDNELMHQYIRDDFDIVNDVIASYKNFRNDAMMSIVVPITYEGKEEKMNFDNEFWGEGKPQICDSFKKTDVVHYDEGDIDFYKSYFDFSFSELGIKLVFLKYYYEKFFLPIHAQLNSISLSQQVWMNDVKYINKGFPKITAMPIFIGDLSINVEFPSSNVLFFENKKEIVDSGFNVFTDIENKSKTQLNNTFYYIYDNVVEIPIKFLSKREFQIYDVILNLYKDDKCIYTNNFVFTQTYVKNSFGEYKSDSEYSKFVIHPKTLNTFINKQQHNKQFDINYWLSSNYKLTLYVNGNNYEYSFTMKLAEMNLCMGTLEYKYDERFKQIAFETKDDDAKLKLQAYMHMPNLVTINNIDVVEDLYFFQDSLLNYIKKHYKSYANINKKFLNRCHMYKIERNNGTTYEEISATANASSFIELFNLGDENENGDKEFISIEYDNALYKMFFRYDSYSKTIKEITKLYNLINANKMQYDAFFMVEAKPLSKAKPYNKIDIGNWYMILISKDTIDGYSDDELEPPFIEKEFVINESIEIAFENGYDSEEQHGINGSDGSYANDSSDEEEENLTYYKFTYERSDIKFLVNRFALNPRDEKYIKNDNGESIENKMYGKYQFTNNDLIAFYLKSTKNLQYKVGLNTKWEISPMSIGMSNSSKTESPNEIAIVGIGGNNFGYERGYYNITCRYSLDDFIQHSMTKTAKFRID